MTYSKKQANVIYRSVKEGKIEIRKETVSALYDNAERETDKMAVFAVRNAVKAIFDGNYKAAQNEMVNFAGEMGLCW